MLVRTSHSRYIEPCLPSPADKPPSGPDWVHEIKHDGYRLMARRDPVGIFKQGNDLGTRFRIDLWRHSVASSFSAAAASASAQRWR
jgi:ATP-dependent DNA ligase